MKQKRFLLPHDRGEIVLTHEVLHHIYKYAQRFYWQAEAGGQLFSPCPEQRIVEINKASGPHKRDIRSRHLFNPDIKMANNDRKQLFANGLHTVGLWHTHPEVHPKASLIDQKTTQDYLRAFSGTMQGFLLLIIGNKGNPPNIGVWVALDAKENNWFRLKEL